MNFAPCTECITKIDEAKADYAEDLDFVIPVYNLIEYSSNYSKAQEVYGFIQKMKQLILMLILQTLTILSTRRNYIILLFQV